MFFSCETAVNTARKAWFKACEESFKPVFNPEKKAAFQQKLTCVLVKYRLYLACIWAASQVNGLLMWSRKDKKYTIIHTYTQTIFGKQFQEARCAVDTPGLKTVLLE